jgi:uncharacterized membrane protein YphA (DoxX/SURF4 family)
MHNECMFFLTVLAGLMLGAPFFAHAHTRWFAEGELAPFMTSEPGGLYLALWFGIVAIVVAAGIWLEKRRWFQFHFLKPRAPHAFTREASLFSMVTGAFLMIAGTHEYLFSPNLSHEAGIPMTLIMMQFALGLSFLLGIFARVSALGLIAMWALIIPVAGWVSAFEDVWVLSSALFILIMGNDYFSVVTFKLLAHLAQPYQSYALPVLRVGTGLTLLTLGFTEKILHPEFGINFLRQYDWNFMQMLGFPYSDYLFTLSAGVVEALFGLIFILGILPRLNALVIAIFFSIPLFLLGPIELAGHVPHFAAVVFILLFGAGAHWKLMRPS